MTRIGMVWTPDEIATLRRLAGEGASSRAIAEAMGRSVPTVRLRACQEKISIARRKAAPKPPKPPRVKAAPKVVPKSWKERNAGRGVAGLAASGQGVGVVAAAPAPAIAVPPAPPPEGGVPFLDLKAGQCRLPLWGNGARPALDAMRFCGAATLPGSSWCPACAKRVLTTEAAERQAARAHMAQQARERRPQRVAWGAGR